MTFMNGSFRRSVALHYCKRKNNGIFRSSASFDEVLNDCFKFISVGLALVFIIPLLRSYKIDQTERERG